MNRVMNRVLGRSTTAGVLAATALVSVLLAGCMGPTPMSSDGVSLPRHAAAAHVEMENIQFEPRELRVPVGATVTWTNHDPVEHTVTPTDKALWGTEGSGDDPERWLAGGDTWSFTFASPGVYTYYCIPHASRGPDGAWRGMVGTIIVGDAEGSRPEAPLPVPNATVVPNPVAPPRAPLDRDGLVRIALEAREVRAQLADGVGYEFWTFGGTVPGPMLRVGEGDTVEFTLANAADSQHAHSIDLHAVTGPGGGAKATQTAPGEATSFRFKALNPGLYVYHCATPHIPTHVANGMYGLILVEPREGLPPVDREYYVVQGEFYTAGKLGEKGLQAFSFEKMLAEDPEYFAFNGRVGALTGEGALRASVGETVRLYVGVGGFVPSSFHVIGEIFDRVWPEGGSPPVEDVQTTLIPAGGAAIVEFRVEVPGTYVLVDHTLTRAIDRGAAGHLVVEGPENREVFRAP